MQMNYHKLLDRQVHKFLPEAILNDPGMVRFLHAVNDSYISYERDKELSEHAFHLSEKEFSNITNKLAEEVESRTKSIIILKEAIRTLKSYDDSSFDFDEENLDKIAEYIEKLIRARKEAENELIKAKEDAEKASKAKSDFLSMMSHEIRTPLNAVIGMIHLLLQNDPKQEQLQNMQTLKYSAEHLLMIINDILDFNKIEAGKIDFENTEFNLKKLALSIKLANQPKALEKGNRIQLMVDEDLPEFVVGDPTRLGQILSNLVSNAIKFTHEGLVRIEVSLYKMLEDGVAVEFAVTDTGIGITDEQKEVIFDKFSQASSDTTRKYGGTGLGLSIIKRLLELQGSQIKLDSTPGKGSRFYFTLEFRKSTLKQENISPIIQIAPEVKADLSGVRILLVEDNVVNVTVASQFLRNWNSEFDVANNGKEAVSMVGTNHYDLILMDLQMPVMDGYDATLAIRRFNSELPIIALTASAQNDVKEKALAAGVNDFAVKPFNPTDLLSKIIRLLNNELSIATAEI
jgi:signal transduction histidine kinase/CheY-like chemotaxis protein